MGAERAMGLDSPRRGARHQARHHLRQNSGPGPAPPPTRLPAGARAAARSARMTSFTLAGRPISKPRLTLRGRLLAGDPI